MEDGAFVPPISEELGCKEGIFSSEFDKGLCVCLCNCVMQWNFVYMNE